MGMSETLYRQTLEQRGDGWNVRYRLSPVGQFKYVRWCVFHDEPIELTWSNHVVADDCEVRHLLLQAVV
jgi:hypothetical protein